MISVDAAGMVAETAIVLAVTGGAALTLAVAGAMVEAMFPGVQARMGTRVWASLVWALSVALRLFSLPYLLAVTYVHLGTGRHSIVSRGHHRPGTAQRWKASPRTYDIRVMRQEVTA